MLSKLIQYFDLHSSNRPLDHKPLTEGQSTGIIALLIFSFLLGVGASAMFWGN